MEKRVITINTEIRSAGEEGKAEIFGNGAVVGVTTDLGYIEEVIAPDAFKEADLSDVCVCFNHNLSVILGRNSAGTAQINVDESGNLTYNATDIDLENPSVKAAYRYVERGEVSKSSFMFEMKGIAWEDSEKYGKLMKRVITKIGKVYEAGPVTFPAYEETDASSRSVLEARSKWIAENTDNSEETRAEYIKKYYVSKLK
jgi:HK97 family phage prohead protease